MSARFAATKSPTRQLLLIAVGLLLLFAALDIVSLHRLSDPPTTDDDGFITSKGQTERRTDLVWGTLFVVAGGSFLVAGLGGLVTGRAVVELHDEALRLRVAGPMSYLEIPWQDIVAVRSDRDYGDDGFVPTPVFVVEVADRAGYPDALWGAVWVGNSLQVDADSWGTMVEDVVIRSELMLGAPQESDDL
jgi:hypothetical protein